MLSSVLRGLHFDLFCPQKRRVYVYLYLYLYMAEYYDVAFVRILYMYFDVPVQLQEQYLLYVPINFEYFIFSICIYTHPGVK